MRKSNRLEQMKIYVSTNHDPLVLESIEETKEPVMTEPPANLAADGSMSRADEIKFTKNTIE